MRITLRVPKRLTNQAEQSMPLIEPTERPNKTVPISAVETDKMSRMAGVRVAQKPLADRAKRKT